MKTPTMNTLLLLNLFMVSCSLIMWSTMQQWRSHTRGYTPPVRKIHNFLVCDFSVTGLHVKPSGCANIFVS